MRDSWGWRSDEAAGELEETASARELGAGWAGGEQPQVLPPRSPGGGSPLSLWSPISFSRALQRGKLPLTPAPRVRLRVLLLERSLLFSVSLFQSLDRKGQKHGGKRNRLPGAFRMPVSLDS